MPDTDWLADDDKVTTARLRDLAERGMLAAAALREMGLAFEDVEEYARQVARQAGVSISLEQLRRVGPGFEVRIPGMDLSE